MFGGSMFNSFEEDPFFRDIHERHRQQMAGMNAMFVNPFFAGPHGGGPLGGNPFPAIQDSSRQHRQVAERRPQHHRDPYAMSPFGMMGGGLFGMDAMMGNMRQSFERMANDPNSQSFSSTTVMSYSNTGDGPPKVYQASTSTKRAPGGVKETRKSVRDSVAGTEKMAIGHHMGNRGHVIERSRNTRTGDMEENQELINLDENEADEFNREFTRTTKPYKAESSLTGPMRHARRDYPAITDSRREYRDDRHSARHHRDRTPPRPTGPTKGGRKHDRKDMKQDRPLKHNKKVQF